MPDLYIMNDRSGTIVNSDYVMEFYLSDTSDSTLLSMRYQGIEKPITLERYKTRAEAMDALSQLFHALRNEEPDFCMPQSAYYFEEHIKRDARTKRRGGS